MVLIESRKCWCYQCLVEVSLIDSQIHCPTCSGNFFVELKELDYESHFDDLIHGSEEEEMDVDDDSDLQHQAMHDTELFISPLQHQEEVVLIESPLQLQPEAIAQYPQAPSPQESLLQPSSSQVPFLSPWQSSHLPQDQIEQNLHTQLNDSSQSFLPESFLSFFNTPFEPPSNNHNNSNRSNSNSSENSTSAISSETTGSNNDPLSFYNEAVQRILQAQQRSTQDQQEQQQQENHTAAQAIRQRVFQLVNERMPGAEATVHVVNGTAAMGALRDLGISGNNGNSPIAGVTLVMDYSGALSPMQFSSMMLRRGAEGAEGVTGQMGDYVFGQRGLDEVISRLMEQTSGGGAAPADDNAIQSLKTFTIDSSSIASPECAVCMEEWTIGDVGLSLKCSHDYHKSCIVPWLELHGTCPVCRTSVSGMKQPNDST